MTDTPDLEILYPERALDIGGERVTVRELTFTESLRLQGALRPVIEALLPAYSSGEGIGIDTVADALAAHPALACEAMATAAGRSLAWVQGLSAMDGAALLTAFVGVHVPFFAMRLELAQQLRLAEARALAEAKGARSKSAKSSRGSSATATPPTH